MQEEHHDQAIQEEEIRRKIMVYQVLTVVFNIHQVFRLIQLGGGPLDDGGDGGDSGGDSEGDDGDEPQDTDQDLT